MKSIKSHLLTTLLLSLGTMWLLCSGALYLFTKHSLYNAFDLELRKIARDAMLLTRHIPPHMRPQFRDRTSQFNKDGDYFFQVWNLRGNVKKRSNSLGDETLPYEKTLFSKHGNWGFVTLSDGRKIRTLSILQTQPVFKRKQRSKKEQIFRNSQDRIRNNIRTNTQKLHVVVGHDTAQIEATLAKLRLGILLGSLAGLIATITAVSLAVRKGLSPLSGLASQLSKIDSSNLDKRLSTEQNSNELRIVSNKVNELLQRVESAFERERRFGSDLAHEIRTPIAEIRALTEVGLKWPEQFAEDELRQIHQSAQRIGNTTETLMDLTRINSDQLSLEKENIQLPEIVECICQSQQEKIAEKNLSVKINISSEMSLYCSRPLLRIILQNLIGNAIAYAPDGDRVVITQDKDSNSLCIENTSDTLEEADLERMFERFWRKDSARTSTEHAGLGLRLAKLCAERLDYAIKPTLTNNRLSMSLHFTTEGQ